ncbi:MAG: NADH-quinone oxidoreductase subunit NuoG [Gammaproteobacteria bacterium]|nr:NADH-quinone oxidoreductase subunit NuoG [Gammaproteobacteria bacterium]MCY4219287.1 NADH-quinone oxidoreductase subunit NuoG [Gammaproteobacteria bacterium]MCY4276109.1 NADH-quinone oxidoreductase subunit NuoG [Gammaproteobacteria bacterium]
MSDVEIEIDGKTYPAKSGEMLIEVTDRNGIYIPRFCYHEKLSVAANCRMCLIEVERAPKPLPACATPVSNGMKVHTRSEIATEAQKGTMEFLLINHPLDCPVCDQGGECPLQDQALGYGKDNSRFLERKRSVPSDDIGPLIATEMTRCIHCTRCVRFGEEVAGVMEMGAPGRGEHVRITTFLDNTIDSEVSGNMIDLCPVGALTSKPFRFAARSWELTDHQSISSHDCLGSNILIQTLRNRVERVVPKENSDINECWLADRDRFSYQAIHSESRLTKPLIQRDGSWQEVDWETALTYTADGLRSIIEKGKAEQIGGLAHPMSSLEEFHLFQKLMRALGSENIDFRLQQNDFRDDDIAPRFPASELPIKDYARQSSILLIGSNIRKEQPLLSLRIRQGWREGKTTISAINPIDFDLNFECAVNEIAPDSAMLSRIAALANAIADLAGTPVPDEISTLSDDSDVALIARQLITAGQEGTIILGAFAQQHLDASLLKMISIWIAEITGSRLAVLAPGNSAGGALANCLPGTNGLNKQAMFASDMSGFVLLGGQLELDCLDAYVATKALKNADFVVQLTAFKPDPHEQNIHVVLPICSFAETSGNYINCEGRIQNSQVAIPPIGESKPAWKILRVLGNFLNLDGFDQITLDDVTKEVLEVMNSSDRTPSCRMKKFRLHAPITPTHDGLIPITYMPMYRGDALVRNASALQNSSDNPGPLVSLHPDTIKEHSLENGDWIEIGNGDVSACLQIIAEPRVAKDCVLIPAGYIETVNARAPGPLRIAKSNQEKS